MRVAIVGASGAVGEELLAILESRNFPVEELLLFASERSAGTYKSFKGEKIEIKALVTASQLKGCDMALFSAGSTTSKKFARELVDYGCIVIDNSSAFRMDPTVPLVIPEINKEALKGYNGIIANPNCSTIIALMALYPLHKQFELRSFVASTYQAVSGTGLQAMLELENQVKRISGGEQIDPPSVYPHQIAFNVIPRVDTVEANGDTKEELKMLNEGRKILGLHTLEAAVTCVRVPVYRAHSVSVAADFKRAVDIDVAKKHLSNAPGVVLQDDAAKDVYPMPIYASGKDECFVGRVRRNNVFRNGLSFWVVGDQIRKGAALNAVQIAEYFL